VDGYIYQMVTKNFVHSEIVIKGKTKTCYWSIDSFAAIKTGKKCLFYIFPVNFFRVQRLVFKDINFIIEVP